MLNSVRITMKSGHGRKSIVNHGKISHGRWAIAGGRMVLPQDTTEHNCQCEAMDSIASILGTTTSGVRASVLTRPSVERAPRSITRTQVLVLMLAIRGLQPSIDSVSVEQLLRYIIFSGHALPSISRIIREYFKVCDAHSVRLKAGRMHYLFSAAAQRQTT